MIRNKTLLTAILALAVTAGVPTAMSLAAPAAPPASAPKQLGSVSGTVVDSTGKPVAGVIVRLHHHRHMHPGSTTQPAPHPGSTTQPAHPARETTTDANGNFTFANVHPGHHLLVARDQGVGHAVAKIDVQPGQAATANLTLEKGKPAAR